MTSDGRFSPTRAMCASTPTRGSSTPSGSARSSSAPATSSPPARPTTPRRKRATRPDEGQGQDQEAEGTTENRFLMVTVAFDRPLIRQAQDRRQGERTTRRQARPAARPFPANPFAPDPNDPKYPRRAEGGEGEGRARPERLREEDRRRQEAGQELTDRFAAWYYVTPGDSFRSINLDRTALVRPKKAEPASPPGAGSPVPRGTPSFPSSLPPIQP